MNKMYDYKGLVLNPSRLNKPACQLITEGQYLLSTFSVE